MNILHPIMLCLLLAACDSGIHGHYTDGGATSYDFKPDGRVAVTILGETTELPYEQPDADHVRVVGPRGSLSFTRQQDRSWLGSMEVRLTRAGR